MRAARQPAGRRAGRSAGAPRAPALHRAARRRRRHSQIQSVFQRERISRLAHPWGSHAHQFTLAQSTATRYPKATRQRGGVHSAGAADRVRDGGGGVLALRQLLVAGAGGRAGGRLTRGGGRVHARVAPAGRGVRAGARPRQPVGRGLAVAGAAAARAAAARPRPRSVLRRAPSLPWRLPRPPL